MRLRLLLMLAGLVLLMSPGSSHAQDKAIVISDGLSASAERYEVKMGTQWMGRNWKLRFGDYAVVESRMGPTKSSSKGNLLGTKSQTETHHNFSFVLSNKTGDLATVKAATAEATRERHSIAIPSRVQWGADETLSSTKQLSVSITTSGDQEETWTLLMETTYGRHADHESAASLSNGERTISIAFTTSARDGEDSRRLPALGYEFIENERSLCALQYHGGGVWGLNKQIIWMDSSLEPTMKLVLAAAMTSLLQKELREMAWADGPL